MAERDRTDWQERSKAWAARAPQGKSEDDTFNQLIISEAGIKPGEKILDLASGTGNPAVSIALSMDGRGSVTCCDLTHGMLGSARTRARNLDLSIMDFSCADMVTLPFSDNTFDCVTCRFGLMFPDDKVGAAREVLRVLKPGGRVAYVIWGAYDENPAFCVPRRTVSAFLGSDEGPIPGRHSMSVPGTLKGILDEAGFERAEERELRYKNQVADADAYITNGLKRSFGKETEGLSEDRFADLTQAMRDAWAPFVEDGTLQVPNFARLGLGWKPT